MSIHSQLPYDQSTSHARIPAGGIHPIASIDSASDAQVTASFFGSTKALHGEVAIPSAETSTHNHSNQQYSITAVTTSSGAIAERYAYSAYGEPTVLDGSGSTLSSSTINNHYSYTGREWDATVGLYHFRARWMSPKTGRFLGRDPIGFAARSFNLSNFVFDNPLYWVDPLGTDAIPPSDINGCKAKCGNDKSCSDRCDSCGRILDEWLDREKKRKDSGELDKILGDLPNCPCNIKNPKKPNKSGLPKLAIPDKWYGDGACFRDWSSPVGGPRDFGFHPGAYGCIRSTPEWYDPVKPAQQCCYDSSGDLITSGSGAGTPDVNLPNHKEGEVIPFDCAHHLDGDHSKRDYGNQGPHVQAYLQYRPPNNGDNCKDNPTKLPPGGKK
ncbi:MAG: RHS repeat-associated core domain-containing protein [Pirellula sp.]